MQESIEQNLSFDKMLVLEKEAIIKMRYVLYDQTQEKQKEIKKIQTKIESKMSERNKIVNRYFVGRLTEYPASKVFNDIRYSLFLARYGRFYTSQDVYFQDQNYSEYEEKDYEVYMKYYSSMIKDIALEEVEKTDVPTKKTLDKINARIAKIPAFQDAKKEIKALEKVCKELEEITDSNVDIAIGKAFNLIKKHDEEFPEEKVSNSREFALTLAIELLNVDDSEGRYSTKYGVEKAKKENTSRLRSIIPGLSPDPISDLIASHNDLMEEVNGLREERKNNQPGELFVEKQPPKEQKNIFYYRNEYQKKFAAADKFFNCGKGYPDDLKNLEEEQIAKKIDTGRTSGDEIEIRKLQDKIREYYGLCYDKVTAKKIAQHWLRRLGFCEEYNYKYKVYTEADDDNNIILNEHLQKRFRFQDEWEKIQGFLKEGLDFERSAELKLLSYEEIDEARYLTYVNDIKVDIIDSVYTSAGGFHDVEALLDVHRLFVYDIPHNPFTEENRIKNKQEYNKLNMQNNNTFEEKKTDSNKNQITRETEPTMDGTLKELMHLASSNLLMTDDEMKKVKEAMQATLITTKEMSEENLKMKWGEWLWNFFGSVPQTHKNVKTNSGNIKKALETVQKTIDTMVKIVVENRRLREVALTVAKDFREVKTEITTLRTQNTNLTNEVTMVRQDLSAVRTENADIKAQNDRMQAQNAELKSTVDNMSADMKRMMQMMEYNMKMQIRQQRKEDELDENEEKKLESIGR